MKNSPFKKTDLWEITDKSFVISIDDSYVIDIKELDDRSVVILPEQLPELVLNQDIINDKLAEAILLSLKKKTKIEKTFLC